MKTFSIGSKKLDAFDIYSAARSETVLSLSPKTKKKIIAAHSHLKKVADSGEVVYGVNTGFGQLSNVRIKKKDLVQLQINILRSHAVGTGDPISPERARMMLLLRIVTLCQGHSGVALSTVEGLIEIYNKHVIPWIPEQGSVGASGDLSPLAHLALVLIGEGKAYFNGELMSGGEALQKAEIKPRTLGPKEGLALINGTQFMLALGIDAYVEASNLLEQANIAGAMSLEAMRGTTTAFDPKIQAVRPHPGQQVIAHDLLSILGGKNRSEISKSHAKCDRVQDPYSLRCMPQVHGAVYDVLKFVQSVLDREVESVTDNPLIFSKERQILSGGNFHGEILAFALDFLAISVAELASISEQRIEKLMNPVFSSLPIFLVKNSGVNSGLMIVQVAASSLVSENKTLCHPASVDSIPSQNDKEDHVSMGAWAARKALKVVENTRRVIAMEYLCAAQGVDLLRPLKSSKILETVLSSLREQVPFIDNDREFHEDIAKIEQWMQG
jgi:histidine ammonia-lyase